MNKYWGGSMEHIEVKECVNNRVIKKEEGEK